jgi:hypothetical protein
MGESTRPEFNRVCRTMIDYRASYKKTIYLALLGGTGCAICGFVWGWLGTRFTLGAGLVVTTVTVALPVVSFILGSLFCFSVVLGGIFALRADWRKQ